ncbi:MAG: hypothetical protein KF702_08830, partial [Gammaproteobacteria bacterium]|nr:hypothetical protein [Gammaproteobacteria bacterium]
VKGISDGIEKRNQARPVAYKYEDLLDDMNISSKKNQPADSDPREEDKAAVAQMQNQTTQKQPISASQTMSSRSQVRTPNGEKKSASVIIIPPLPPTPDSPSVEENKKKLESSKTITIGIRGKSS